MLPQEARTRIRKLRRRCNLAVFLSLLCVCSAVYLSATGCFVLAARLFWYAAASYTLVLGPGWLLCPVVAYAIFNRRRYSDAEVEGLTDRMSQAKGLLLTLSSCSDPQWQEDLGRSLRGTRFRLPGFRSRAFLTPLPYAVFLVFALLLPQRTPALAAGASPLQYEELKKLEQQLAVIKDEEILSKEESQSLKEEVERMLKQPAESQESRWQAIDSLKERVAAETESVSQEIKKAQKAAAWGDREQVERALSSLAQRGMTADLPPELAGALQTGGKGFLKDMALLEKARDFLDACAARKSAKLARAGVCPQRQPGEGPNLDDFESSSACRGSCGKKGEGEDGFSLSEGFDDSPGPDGDGKPGSGGVNRGRGDAPMVWGKESDEQKAKFSLKELPPVTIAPGQEMPVVGVSLVEPETTEAPAVSAPGRAVELGDTTGADTWRRTLSPRHRPIVRRYFAGEGEKK